MTHTPRFPDPASLFTVDRSGTCYRLTDPRWHGDDGSPLSLAPLPACRPEDIDTGERSLWRYAAALPVDRAHRVSLGEGCTPEVPLDWAGGRVRAKLEWFAPTSSFKDRGMAVLVSHLRGFGARHVLEDSSGNGGSSLAAYAAAAGLKGTVLVPEGTSAAKIAMVRAFGARVEVVPGTRDQVSAEAVRRSASIPYASHAWHPMFLQGVKTLGYEIWESAGFRAPSDIVMVAGGGSQVLGCHLAFSELRAAGLVDRLPRLWLGQPEHFSPIVHLVEGTRPAEAPSGSVPPPRTVAEGAAIDSPVRGPEVAAAVRESGGGAVAVGEEEIREALTGLLRRGLYAEPTAAVAAAALTRLRREGRLPAAGGEGQGRPRGQGASGAGEGTVLVLSGTGLKAADAMARALGAA
ncbi:pyridoxal-phosphate dependent enzyme [Brevibacterium litoralis]|uniref:pyridoxal-phosphate dependent enzyme n=1 Tax=Brevibacterium litoralis TaxID=3138935 RepID=UPI0032EF1B3E